jgi:hypothetical protein
MVAFRFAKVCSPNLLSRSESRPSAERPGTVGRCRILKFVRGGGRRRSGEFAGAAFEFGEFGDKTNSATLSLAGPVGGENLSDHGPNGNEHHADGGIHEFEGHFFVLTKWQRNPC